MLLQYRILLLLALLGPSSATNLTCNNDLGYCLIQPKKVKADEATHFVNIPSETNYVVIKSCELTRIPHQLFLDVKNLTALDLSFNKIQAIGSSDMWNALRLQQLVLKNNSLTIIHNYDFVSTTLIDLDLSFNMINEIEVEAFSKIGNLTNLNLSNNQLKILNDGVFHKLLSLVSVILSGNFLKTITCNLFKNNLDLLYLNVEFNKVDTIPISFSHLKNLQSFLASGNLLTSSPELVQSLDSVQLSSNLLKSVKLGPLVHYVWIDNNFITTINCSANMAIDSLHANNNSFTALGCIKDMNDLSVLHLAYNKIAQISKDMFMNLQKLSLLDISFNPIKKLTPDMFSGLLSLNLLHVDVMSNSENIRAELPTLDQISLTTSTWDCEKLLSVAKIYNSQNIMMGLNSFSTEANCVLEIFEINKLKISPLGYKSP